MAEKFEKKIVFLSHISEESELAALIKNSIEREFSGFVDVFVSSDNESITSGTNFLKRIERGLKECFSAIYLISPASLRRPWVNFELGAIWLRSVMSEEGGNLQIPTIPICHSGCSKGELPIPLANLDAVQANNASDLEKAYRSLQRVLGVDAALTTDFEALAASIRSYETNNLVGSSLKSFIRLLGQDPGLLITHYVGKNVEGKLEVPFVDIEAEKMETLRILEEGQLKGMVRIISHANGTLLTSRGQKFVESGVAWISVEALNSNKDFLLD